jgi:plasmid stabilization system protein ParE
MARARRVVVESAAAQEDLVEIADALDRHLGPHVSDRFIAAYGRTAQRLARMPGTGAPWPAVSPATAGRLRYATLDRFKKYLLFYAEVPAGIRVVRILIATRDLDAALAAGAADPEAVDPPGGDEDDI